MELVLGEGPGEGGNIVTSGFFGLPVGALGAGVAGLETGPQPGHRVSMGRPQPVHCWVWCGGSHLEN